MPQISLEHELLAQALRSPHGIILQVSDFDAVRQRLYKVRAKIEIFRQLEINASPRSKLELWITRSASLDAERAKLIAPESLKFETPEDIDL